MTSTASTAEHLPVTAGTVQAIWADLLGLGAVGPNDDFFELGGHSLMAAAAVAKMSETLGLQLPPLALFEAPTPAEMAELIAELRAGTRPDDAGFSPFHPPWVVPLQREGHLRPVFVFPAGHDEFTALAIEARVAAHVGRDRPFWGLGRGHPALDLARSSGVPAVAAAYVEQIRVIQGAGPYLLYANCAGGSYAWETAAQLLAAGEEIAGMLFYEVPLDARRVAGVSVVTPALASPERADPDDYEPRPLPVELTLVMSEFWSNLPWSDPWRVVALGGTRTAVIPNDAVSDPGRREVAIAERVLAWIDRTEAHVRGA